MYICKGFILIFKNSKEKSIDIKIFKISKFDNIIRSTVWLKLNYFVLVVWKEKYLFLMLKKTLQILIKEIKFLTNKFYMYVYFKNL